MAPSITVRPLPGFQFGALWDGHVLSFHEVSGLDGAAQPGHGEVTMKRGVFRGDARFWDWFDAIKTNRAQRKPLTIRLLDETGKPAMTWTLAKAWPIRITGPDLASESSDVAIEALVIAHEGLTIAGV